MSMTSTWVAAKKYQRYLWQILILLITFAAGWQVGKVMSPYYAANPIVFSEAQPTSADLNTLLESSQALQAGATGSPQPTVASAISEERPAPRSSPSGVGFVGSVNSDLYHDPSCSSASRIKPANQVWFATREEAETAGYSPSACTKEKLGL